MRYPYSRQSITDNDVACVVEALKKPMITQGSLVEEFESELATTFGAKYAVVCNSGTAALHMAYSGLGLGPNAGLVTSAITFSATANAARMCEAPVAFADVDPINGNITGESVRNAIELADFPVKVIAVVHLGGRPCNIPEIQAYADSIGALVVEDACHAPLAQYPNSKGNLFNVGSCSHSVCATLSLHAIKHITTGEGGVVLTNQKTLADTTRLIRSHGITRNRNEMLDSEEAKNPWYYEMLRLGYNYRLSDINCALGLSQLSRLDSGIEYRNQLALAYHEHLSDKKFIALPQLIEKSQGRNAWHLFAPNFDFSALGISRKYLVDALKAHSIGSQVNYIPLYRHPYYARNLAKENFPGAEKFYSGTLSLPIHNELKVDDIEFIAKTLSSIID